MLGSMRPSNASSRVRAAQSRPQLAESLASFAPPEAIGEVLRELESRGWIEKSEGLHRLTEQGKQEQELLAPLIGRVRHQVATALPGDDYATLLRLLEQLVTGLEAQA